jgi:transcription-repair coupling factor (superfamily II helicase)
VIVASVSCIYGLGSPEEYEKRLVNLSIGEEHDRDELLRKLVDTQYVRNDTLLGRGRFRVKGDVIEVQPASAETAYRISLFGDEVEQITHFDPLTGEVYAKLDNLTIFPATQYVTSKPTIDAAMGGLRAELEAQVSQFEAEGKLLEAHRIRQRTEYDIEMMKELGFCNGIENYSRVLEDARPGRRHTHCSTTSRPTSSASSTNRIKRCRRSVACTKATGPGSRRWSTRLPPAVGARQPAAAVRRVPATDQADHLRLSDTGRLRAAKLGGGQRAADPSDGHRRPGRGAARDEESDR